MTRFEMPVGRFDGTARPGTILGSFKMNQTVLEQTELKTSSFAFAPSRWLLFTALGLLVCVVSALIIFPKIATSEFSADEGGWISSAYYYTTLAEKGDLNWDKWFCRDCQGFGRLNLHAGQFLFGVPLKMELENGAKPYFGYYDVEHSYQQNFREGLVAPPAIVTQARRVAAFFGVLCCLLIFAVGFWAYNPWVGLTAAGLLMTNSVFLKLAAEVMTDAFYNFFLLSICLTLVMAARSRNRKTIFWLFCLAGVFTALACSVKITGLLVGTGFFLGAAAWHFWRDRTNKKEMAITLVAFFAFCLGTVYLLNPFFWPSWKQMSVSQIWQEGKSFTHDIATKTIVPWSRRDLDKASFTYPQLRNLSHPVEFPLLFGRWSHELHRHLEKGAADWHSPRLVELQQSLFRMSVPLGGGMTARGVWVNLAAIVIAALTIAGVYFLARSLKSDGRNVVLLTALVVNYMLIVLFMKLNWDRYYLPTMISVDLVAAVGLYEIARRAIFRRRQNVE